MNGKGAEVSFGSAVFAWLVAWAPVITDVAQAVTAVMGVVAMAMGMYLYWRRIKRGD